jgi:hypothetical protein
MRGQEKRANAARSATPMNDASVHRSGKDS